VSPAPSVTGLLLAPGASAGREQPALVAIDQAVSRLGLLVERIDFPYRLAGRRRPDAPFVLVETVRASAQALAAKAGTDFACADPSARGAGAGTGSVVLGGRSMGGRICSMAVAEGLPAAGLVLVSYPLHPPGRPDKLRSDHFGSLKVPCLFVSGGHDAFALPSELEAATRDIPGPVTHRWVDGDHGLKRRDSEVASLVAEWIQSLMGADAPKE
jgi:predicted alpha/beta-hydrolase family hydrolase